MTGADIARTILDANSFMTLATADGAGTPWATPVWFATDDHRDLYWVSRPTTRHSENLATRPEVSIVVYDSTVKPGDGQAVYMTGTAALVPEPEIEHGMAVFSRAAERQGLGEWGTDRVTGAAELRLYRATITEHYILDPDAQTETRIEVLP
jgi:nitroimidazol reductase NimA-like FMN-containing flavoprotein (pyridoxamine 5'-phosphate oxidase superfamily)